MAKNGRFSLEKASYISSEKSIVLKEAIKKIKALELPCYAIECEIGWVCEENNLCDACKVREILRGL